MPVLNYTTQTDGKAISGIGYLFSDLVVTAFELNVAEAIQADISAFVGGYVDPIIISAFWKPYIEVVSSVPSKTDIWGGIPPRQRYGRITYAQSSTPNVDYFITTQFQVFPVAICNVYPLQDQLPFNASSFPPPELVAAITTPIYILAQRQIGSYNVSSFSDQILVENRTMAEYRVNVAYYFGMVDFSSSTGTTVIASL